MKLELKRNNLKTYKIASVLTFFSLLGLLYLFAYAPHIDTDPDLLIFANYNNIMTLFSILSMTVFATISSVMYANYVIEEYKDKCVILLFSYPVKRSKVLFAKIFLILLFTLLAMICCNFIAFGIFSISESVYPLVTDTLTPFTALHALKNMVLFAVTASATGIVALGIGFIKKSVPSTILSAVLISSLFSNIMFNAVHSQNHSDLLPLLFTGITVIAGAIVTVLLAQKITTMEAL
jgi:hypothetical protein